MKAGFSSTADNQFSALATGGVRFVTAVDDGQVAVDDLLTMVNIALGTAPITECPAGDGNGDGHITVDDILAAVNNALNRCPGAPAS